jgi:5'-nucleotidase / UDP-sugar diphosphatase
MVAMFLMAIPKYAKGKLTLVPKNKEGQPLKSKVEALNDPRSDTPIYCRQRVRRWIEQVSTQ